MNLLISWLRGFRALLHIFVGVILAIGIALTGGSKRWRVERVMSWWSGVMLDIFNIRVDVHGSGLQGSRLLVANHVSWLDIILIGSVEPTRFVAKSEIQHWPVAGWLAYACGTFYIRRGKGGAKPLLEKAVPHLHAGGALVLYPEGTTTDGSAVLPFHPRLFQAAIDANCPVQPMALRYGRAAGGGNIAPFIGDDDLVSHMLRLLREPALTAQVIYCAPLPPQGLTRDALALAAQNAIGTALEKQTVPEPEFDLIAA